MAANRYIKGEWNAICDVCGFKKKSHELKKRWDGLMVCRTDWETRHPQDLLRVKPEKITPPWVRPESTDVFVLSCDIWSSSPMADYGTADCMTVNGNTSIELLISIFEPRTIAELAIAGRSITGVY